MLTTKEMSHEVSEKVKEVRADAEIAGRVAAGFGHAVILAGLGAAGMVMDESEALVKRLVDRGVIAEQDTRKEIEELRQRVRRVEMPASDPLHKVEDHIKAVLGKMNVPTRDDIVQLEGKIQALSGKIDTLLAAEAAPKAKRSA